MRSQQELEQERNDDLRRIVETEALLLLLLRRSRKAADDKSLHPAKRAERVYRSVKNATRLAWDKAVRDSYRATLEQAGRALDAMPELAMTEAEAVDAMASAGDVAAAQAGHSVSQGTLAEAVDGQKPNHERKGEVIAATVATTVYGATREETVQRLPRRQREELWVRRDTAGDRRVCPVCEKMDGDVAPVSKWLSPKVPLHPNCRCSDTIISKDEAMIVPERRAPVDAPEPRRDRRPPPQRAKRKPVEKKAPEPPRKPDPEIERAKRKAALTREIASRKALLRREKRARLAEERRAARRAKRDAERRIKSERLKAEKKSKANALAAKRAENRAVATARREEQKRAATELRAAKSAAAKRAKADKLAATRAEAKAKRDSEMLRRAEAKKAAAKAPQDPRAQPLLDEFATERAALNKRLASMEARVAEGKPDKWGVIGTTRKQLEQLGEREARIKSAMKIRAKTKVTSSVDEAVAGRILTSAEHSAVSNFTGNTFVSVRAQQRGLLRGPKEFLDQVAAEGAALERAIAQNVSLETELWRGIVVDQATAKRLIAQDTIDWMGATTSTSRSRTWSEKFAKSTGEDSVGILFRVKRGRGMPVHDLGLKEELEVMQSGASVFRVVERKREGNRWVVDLEHK